MKKIDIIIPAYKAQKTIGQTIASIAMQTMVDDVKVTICNDADEEGYSSVVNNYSNILDIQQLILPENSGCGIARQYGIDRTDCPHIIFMDADDTFNNAYAIEVLYETVGIEEFKDAAATVGNFIESTYFPNLNFVPHNQDFIWMFGKLYNRAFLEKYNIRFNGTCANEDNGFNTLVSLSINKKEEKIVFVDVVTYVWHFNKNSMTRINNFEYMYHQSIIGFSDNMIWAIQSAIDKFGLTDKIVHKAVETMVSLYVGTMRTIGERSEFTDCNYKASYKFYDEVYRTIENCIDIKSLMPNIFFHLEAKCPTNLKNIIPELTFNQFMNVLRNRSEIDFVL